tara:strand:+ start:768 stop:989 length:222 start_codon:yes stop_codon:yes gene_type:complete
MSSQRILGIENGVVVSVSVSNVNRYRNWDSIDNENHGELNHRRFFGDKSYGRKYKLRKPEEKNGKTTTENIGR